MPPEVALPDNPANSPSGKYVLTVDTEMMNGVEVYYFQILDTNQNILFAAQDRFSIQHTTYFLWDQDDRVWVYSGDVGTFFWERMAETNEWKQFVYAENNVSAPPFLKEARPRWHQK